MADLSDEEQLDAMRSWWAENGNYVMGGIAAGLLIIFGWNRWQSGIAETEIAASTLFEDVLYAAGLGQLERAVDPATTLFDEYGSTPYAAQARLAMARMYMDNSQDQDAAEVLRPLLELDAENELAMVARLRLAKILLYQGKAEEAVGILKDNTDNAYAARFNELMGDAYVSTGAIADAEAAYIAAMNDNPAAPTVDLSLIQLKINDLPAVDEIAAAVDAAGILPEAAEDASIDDTAAVDDEEDQASTVVPEDMVPEDTVPADIAPNDMNRDDEPE